jgi:hypothetical protein
VSSVIVVFQGSGYGLSNPTLTKFIAMAAIIAAAASYTTSGDTIRPRREVGNPALPAPYLAANALTSRR